MGVRCSASERRRPESHVDAMQSQTPSPIRWGIAATGTMAKQFARDLERVDGAVLVAVSSRSQDKATAFAGRFGGVTAHASLETLLADDTVDAVYVASPNHVHLEAAQAAIAAGKAVLVEKPLVLTSAEAERLAALSAQRDVFLMEAMWTRFLPSVVHVKRAVASGIIGAVKHIRADLAIHHPYDPGSRFYARERGGGALLDLGVYGISLALHLMGQPESVRGNWQAAPTGVDASATVALGFAGGAEAHLSCAIDRAGDNLFVIEGAEGTLVLQPPFIGSQMVLRCKGGLGVRLALAGGQGVVSRAARKLARTVPLPGITRDVFAFDGYGLQFEIAAVGEAIRNGWREHPLAPVSDTIRTLKIIETVLAGESRSG